MNLKERRNGYMGGFRKRKQKGEMFQLYLKI